jgi:hypothetical protein
MAVGDGREDLACELFGEEDGPLGLTAEKKFLVREENSKRCSA